MSQKKKDKRANNDLQNTTQKPKDHAKTQVLCIIVLKEQK
jgi:hypothetical protein